MSDEELEIDPDVSDEAERRSIEEHNKKLREDQKKYHELKLKHRALLEDHEKLKAALDIALERIGAAETLAQYQMHQLEKKLRYSKKQCFKEISETLK